MYSVIIHIPGVGIKLREKCLCHGFKTSVPLLNSQVTLFETGEETDVSAAMTEAKRFLLFVFTFRNELSQELTGPITIDVVAYILESGCGIEIDISPLIEATSWLNGRLSMGVSIYPSLPVAS